MRPIGGIPFGRSHRTGLLWALENLAWADEFFMRTVLVLGRLAERVIDDNLVNKPSGSLSSIFRSWMPQTGAKMEHRKAALAKLVVKHPAVAWPICIEQFSAHSRIGHYSHKPRWRPDERSGVGGQRCQNRSPDAILIVSELGLNVRRLSGGYRAVPNGRHWGA